MAKSDFKFKEVRVRFAPSPTGPFHIGNARAALFNYLFAKKEKGKFILRIEDTDLARSDPKFEKDIIDSLKWLGIEWDEFHRQSERIETYAKYLEKLLKDGLAYRCFCSEEELEAKRQERMSRGLPPVYNGKCQELTKEELKQNLAKGKPSIIRFKIPTKKIIFPDLIRGEIIFDSSLIGDFSIAKDLATPLYNFAVVIDDFEMEISHVIRGEDHISNTPKQILLQEALNFPQPKYAHLPLILGPDRSKLSKRHGAVAIADYRKDGYLPEAIVNFMAFLGWNPGTEKEIFSLKDLAEAFSLPRVQKGGAVFNLQRLDYLNGVYIRQCSLEKLTELCLPYFIEEGFIEPIFETKERVPDLTGYFGKEIVQEYVIKNTKEKIDFDYLQKTVLIYQERLNKLSGIKELTDFFFEDVLEYDKELLRWKNMTDGEVKETLDKLDKILCDIGEGEWTKDNLEKVLMPAAGGDKGRLLWPLRAALTGKKASAGPFEIAAILGKEKTLKRIKDAKTKF